MIFNTYEWKDYKPDILMKGLEKLKEYFEYYKEREAYTQKYHYYMENIDGYWVSFPIILVDHRAYFCPVLITPWSNEVYKRLDELQKNFLTRINMIPELKDKFVIKATLRFFPEIVSLKK